MMLDQLLADLRQQNIELWVEGDRLRYRGAAGALTPELLERLRAHKAGLIDFLQQATGGAAVEAIPRVPRTTPLPLSFAQQRLWLLSQLEPDNATYNVPVAWRINGPLDPAALERAWTEIVRRHESLRTTFVAPTGGDPVQVIAPAAPAAVPVVDLPKAPATDRARQTQEWLRTEAHRLFDLARGPLARLQRLRVADDEHVLLLTMHHVVSDGWSVGVLARELSELYDAFAAGRTPALTELPIQYADFAVWQRHRLQGDRLDQQLGYWRDQLNGASFALDLPADFPRPPVQSERGDSVPVTVPRELTRQLEELSRREGATLYMTLLAAFQTLLHRYSGQDDIIVGSPSAGRDHVETEGLIGFFINTLVVRGDLSGNPSFRTLLQRVRETALGAFAHQDLPFENLVEELQPTRDLSRPPLCQTMFILQNTPAAPLQWAGVTVTPEPLETDTAKYDLTLELTETATGLTGTVGYCTGLFKKDRLQRLVGHFTTLLEGIVANPDQAIGALPLLTPAERQQILVEWNDNGIEFHRDQTMVSLVEDQVARTPNATALIAGVDRLTYAEVNARANQLAHHLRRLGVGPETLVAVCAERTPVLATSLLAILKAGGAYAPVDPAYPKDRTGFILEDTKAKVLLTQTRLLPELPSHDAVVVNLDTVDLSGESRENPVPLATASNLAYLIFTSGSTGRPKAVAIEHRSAVAFIEWARTVYRPTDWAGMLFSTSICFDLSIYELFGTLSCGGAVILAENALQLPSLPAASEVTLINTVPSAMAELVRAKAVPANVRIINLAGELLAQSLVDQVYALGHIEKLYDLYGPSEDTTYSTYTLRTAGGIANIGRPIANTQAYLLDARHQPVPVGVPGEILLGGEGLARGYLHRPELTAEKFIPNPFASKPGERLYRTGDLGRYLPDGRIEYVGRIDRQVKIRGFRIELGEVQTVLRAQPQVAEAVVMAREDTPGDKRLVAYVVAKAEPAPTTAELRDFLRVKLPEYMIPSAFVFLKALPLTPNGKVDQRALPVPELDRQDLGQEFVAPRTPLEKTVADIWAEVLRVPQVGIHDNFFAMGGHSLLAVQVGSRLRAVLGLDFPMRTLFEKPTVAELAAHLDTQHATATGAIQPRPRPAKPALSFAQHRLWLLDQLEPGSAVYNVPLALRLQGKLNVPALEQAFSEMVRRHETLRTTFAATADEQPYQVIAAPEPVRLSVVDLRSRPAAERQVEAKRRTQTAVDQPFDLARGPLLRVLLLQVEEEEHVLVVNVHHIVFDGWSTGVLTRELSELYRAYLTGRPAALPALPIQYTDFADWQRDRLQDAALQEEIAYWRQNLAGSSLVLELPTDHPRPPTQSYRGASLPVELPKELSQQLLALSQHEGVTLFMTLLAAFQVLLQRYSGQDDLIVGFPSAGRDRVETEGLIGFFINTLAARADLTGQPSFRTLLGRVRETTLGALAHQDVQFEKLLDELHMPRDPSRSPLCQVVFALQNMPGGPMVLPVLTATPLALESTAAKFDLALGLWETADGLRGSMEYCRDLFSAARMRRMLGHYRTLLEAIAANPEQPISELPVLTAAERDQLLEQWNQTQTALPADVCVPQRVEAQSARTPDALAVADGRESLTYRQLNDQANTVARALRALGIGPESLVGVCLERSPRMIVGLLGVLKAGGAYVPFDPGYPTDRVAFMLADAGISTLLTQQSLRSNLPGDVAHVLCLDGPEFVTATATNLPATTQPGHLAYVIYTSGSTGQPKGVQIEHGNLLNLVTWHQRLYEVTAADRATQLASPAFDASVWEIWPYLTCGASLHIPDEETRLSPPQLLQWMQQNQITISFVPTPLAEPMLDGPWPAGLKLRAVLTGGDRLRRYPPAAMPFRLYNNYGPTENTVVTTAALVPAAPAAPAAAPHIGRPVDNCQVYVLDKAWQPVPIGVPGELFIGGASLARGYLNRPELTAEKFVACPFTGGRMYQTGDLVRFLEDGNIEYIGRTDFQVKIRGNRIELGEIEAVLGQHDAVRDAAVAALPAPSGESRLVGYIVAGNGAAPAPTELREFLKQRLPEYMVPTLFVFLPALPLTANGKVNRKALPAPDQSLLTGEQEFVAPRSAIEQQLADIWQQTLRRPQVGIHDNFFELGGDSILTIQIIARARRAGVQLTPKQFFQHPTIAELAAVATMSAGVQADQGMATGEVALTPIQRWFFERPEQSRHHWNQAVLLETRERLDPAQLEQAVARLLEHHDALRLRFTPVADGGWRQTYSAPAAAVPLWRVDLSGRTESEQAAAITAKAGEAQASLNITDGPLLRVVHFDCGPDRPGRLLIAIHHLAVDGVSWRVLLEDLQAAYRQQSLPAKTSSFQQWSARLAAYAQSPALKAEAGYWLAAVPTETKRLPVDQPADAAANTEASARQVTVTLNAEETRALLQDVPAVYHTQINDVLLTALTRTLTEWLETDMVAVDLESHGRDEVLDGVDVSRTVGWFTAMYPARLELARGATPGAALKAIKEQLRQIPHHGIGYGVLRYGAGYPELQGQPAADIVFNYLGQMDANVDESSRWMPARESTGATHGAAGLRTHLVEVGALVQGGTLTVDWGYSAAVHQRATIERLAQRFITVLRELIAHCQSPAAGGFTPSDFPLAKLDQATVDRLADREVEDIYPLSPMQKLFYAMGDPRLGLGLEQWVYRIDGALEVPVFQQAWQRVIDRHSILRTQIVAEGLTEPVQIARRTAPVLFQLEDWRAVPAADQPSRLEEFLGDDRARGLDFTQAPLMRLTLVQLADQQFQFVWTTHHIILDGWSWPIVLNDLAMVYGALRQGREPQLEPVRPYRDYVAWLQEQDLAKVEAFWRRELDGITEPTPLANRRPAGLAAVKDEDAEEVVDLPAELTGALQAAARQHQLTINTVVQGAWALGLSRDSGRLDVVLGAAASGRPTELPRVESMVGLFINNLPVRVRIKPDLPVLGWLKELQEQQAEWRQFEFSPPMLVQECSAVPWHQRLFETLVVFQNYTVDESAQQWLGSNTRVEQTQATLRTNYPLTLMVVPGRKLTLRLAYHRRDFEPADVRRLLENLSALFAGLVANPQQPVAALREQWPAPRVPAVSAGSVVGKQVTTEFVAPRDQLEQQLTKFWESLFGRSPIGVRDNFFALGGHSLLAVRLFAQVEKLTGKRLPMVTLFQAPTIEELAKLLRQEGWEAPWWCLVPIKADGSRPPFYCVHGVGGNILEYMDLAKYMEPDQPFYGLQAMGLDGKRAIKNETVEDMAARYVQEIRAFQSKGPYYIGGSSFGGVVAFEMARMLVAAGEEMGLLAFFDTNAPGYPQYLPGRTVWQKRWHLQKSRVALHWGNLRAARGWEKVKYVTGKYSKLFSSIVLRTRRNLYWFRRHTRERLDRLFWPDAIREVKKRGYWAAGEYQAKPYSGKATLFRAIVQPPDVIPDRTLGWGPLVQGGIEIYDTPGHHGAIVRDPRARVLAQQLTEELHKKQAAAGKKS